MWNPSRVKCVRAWLGWKLNLVSFFRFWNTEYGIPAKHNRNILYCTFNFNDLAS